MTDREKRDEFRSLFGIPMLDTSSAKKIEQIGVGKVKPQFDKMCMIVDAIKINRDIGNILSETEEVDSFMSDIEDNIAVLREDLEEKIDDLISTIATGVAERLDDYVDDEDTDVTKHFAEVDWCFLELDSDYEDNLLENILQVILVKETTSGQKTRRDKLADRFKDLTEDDQNKALNLLEISKKK